MTKLKIKIVSLRLDDDEFQRLDEMSLRLNIKRSTLIRRFIESGLHRNADTVITAWDDNTISTLRDCNFLLAKIGVNINQIARRCNQMDMGGSLMKEALEIKQILNEMKEVLGCL